MLLSIGHIIWSLVLELSSLWAASRVFSTLLLESQTAVSSGLAILLEPDWSPFGPTSQAPRRPLGETRKGVFFETPLLYIYLQHPPIAESGQIEPIPKPRCGTSRKSPEAHGASEKAVSGDSETCPSPLLKTSSKVSLKNRKDSDSPDSPW